MDVLYNNLNLEPSFISQKQNIPGPGHYGAPLGINATGQYPLSTIPNSRVGRISPSKRFVDLSLREAAQLPGPGAHNPRDYVNGEYIVSTFRSKGVHSYRPSTEQAVRIRKQETPGPGTYKVPSDFGYLELRKHVMADVGSRNNRTLNSSLERDQRVPIATGTPYAQKIDSRFMQRRKSSQTSYTGKKAVGAHMNITRNLRNHTEM